MKTQTKWTTFQAYAQHWKSIHKRRFCCISFWFTRRFPHIIQGFFHQQWGDHTSKWQWRGPGEYWLIYQIKSVQTKHYANKPLQNGTMFHNSDVIMTTMAYQITGVSAVFSAVCSDQRKHQRSAAFVRGTHRCPVDSPHKGQVTRKMFPFDDVIMYGTHCISPPIWLDSKPIHYSWEASEGKSSYEQPRQSDVWYHYGDVIWALRRL